MPLIINDTTPRVQYVATSGQKDFAVPFEWLDNDEIKVYQGTDDTPISDTLYGLTGAGVTNGGTLSYITGLTEGTVVTIARESEISRDNNYVDGGDFSAPNVNAEMQRLFLLIQENRDLYNRAIKLPVFSALSNLQFPNGEANKVVGWNSDGTELINGPTFTGLTTLEGITAQIQAVAALATEIAALGALATEIAALYGIRANISTVAGVAASIPAVAAIDTEIATVAGDSADIQALAAITAQINALYAVLAELTAVYNNIADISTVAGLTSEITTVAALETELVALNAISTEITTLSALDNKIAALYDIRTDISTVAPYAADIADVAANLLGKNFLINGGFTVDQMQEGNYVCSTVRATLDYWYTGRLGAATGMTVSQQAGFGVSDKSIRLKRDGGNTSTAKMYLAYCVDLADTKQLQGQEVTLSMLMRKGVDYSGGDISAYVFYSTAASTEEKPLSFTGQTNFGSGSVTPTAGNFSIEVTATVPTNATQIGFVVEWTPSGTAGSGDYVEYTDAKWEVGGVATPFRLERTFREELDLCEGRLEKSFAYGTKPQVGSAYWAGGGYALNANRTDRYGMAAHVGFSRRKAKSPTITIYGSANTGYMYDGGVALDRLAELVFIGEKGFVCAGGAGSTTTANSAVVFAWLADARP